MEQTISLTAKWSQGSLIAFRFLFAYFVLYIFASPLQLLSGSSTLFEFLTEGYMNLCGWVAGDIMGLEFSKREANGSGDTTFNYIQIFLFAFFSLVIALLWSVIDRKRNEYEKLLYWLTILLRYYLAVVMIGYGFAKVFKTQFPFPTTYRLYQSYGESSPMGLLWTFMGYSTAYNIFTGLGEVIGGFLLLFRRTRLLGALIVVAVMSNVVMLNFSYDVPVKLFSSHILVLAIFILLPDMKRLLNLFLFNKAVSPESIKPMYSNSATRWLYILGKGLLIILIVVTFAANCFEQRRQLQEAAKLNNQNGSLLGDYEIEAFILNGEVVPPGERDTQRWKKIVIKGEKTVNIQYMDGTSGPWHFNISGNNTKIIIHSWDLSSTGNFTAQADDVALTIEGVLDKNNIKVICRKSSEGSGDSFLLVNRGFHWVNEYPFNK